MTPPSLLSSELPWAEAARESRWGGCRAVGKQKEDGVPPHALRGSGGTSSPPQDLARGCGKLPVRKQCLWTETLWNPDSSQSDHLKEKDLTSSYSHPSPIEPSCFLGCLTSNPKAGPPPLQLHLPHSPLFLYFGHSGPFSSLNIPL